MPKPKDSSNFFATPKTSVNNNLSSNQLTKNEDNRDKDAAKLIEFLVNFLNSYGKDILISIGVCIIVFILLTIICCCVCKTRRKNRRARNSLMRQQQETYQSTADLYNATAGGSTYPAVASAPPAYGEVVKEQIPPESAPTSVMYRPGDDLVGVVMHPPAYSDIVDNNDHRHVYSEVVDNNDSDQQTGQTQTGMTPSAPPMAS